MTDMDLDHLRTWIGKQEAVAEYIAAAPLDGLSATLDRADPPHRDDRRPLPVDAHARGRP